MYSIELVSHLCRHATIGCVVRACQVKFENGPISTVSCATPLYVSQVPPLQIVFHSNLLEVCSEEG